VEADKVAKNLVTVLDAHKKTVTAIELMIQREVKNASTYISSLGSHFLDYAGSLLRSDSMASKMMNAFSASIGKPFLKTVLTEHVKHICENPVEDGISFEVNPEKVPPT
jgi:hypothetical protein